MVTQTQIAKIAGVSRATVERVINNRGDVNDETRKRVLKIIEEMDYRPNRAGKTLAIKQRNLKIGCIIIQADNPFYEELNKGILEAADEFKAYGIDVIIETAVFTAKAQISKINELLEMGMNLEKGFRMGVFRADFTPEGNVNWYSAVSSDDKSPDFHKPDMLFPAIMK